MKYLCLISLAFLVFACTGNGNGNDGGDEKLEWGSATLSVERPIKSFILSHYENPEENLCYHIELSIDTLAGEGELAQQLASVLRDSVLYTPGRRTMREAVVAFADSLEAEWKSELAEMYDPMSEYNETLQFYYKVEGKALSEAPVMSYQTTIDCYLGGAHGSYVISYFNFDKKTGKLLKINDVVPTDKEKEVLAEMKEQLCKDWDAKDMVDLQEKTGITMLGDLYLTNNFLIQGDSITFLFNQYEIAPYAAGLIGITIPSPANQ